MFVLAVQRADSGRTVKLMAGDDVEVAVEVAHVDVEMNRRLRAVDQHRNSARMGDAHRLLDRHHRAEHVRHLRHRDHLGAVVISFSNSSSEKLPSSSTGAHLITAPCRSRRKCHGTILA